MKSKKPMKSKKHVLELYNSCAESYGKEMDLAVECRDASGNRELYDTMAQYFRGQVYAYGDLLGILYYDTSKLLKSKRTIFFEWEVKNDII